MTEDAPGKEPVVLTIDIGGSNVKLMTSDERVSRKFASGPGLTPEVMVSGALEIARDLTFDTISIGYPGPVMHNRIAVDPHNLGPGWVDFDFERALGKPIRLVNDALMQAIGSYEGGRMLFLGLGTGLGAAMVMEHVAHPLELAHLPYRKGMTFEDYVGDRGRKRLGNDEWRTHVFDVVGRLTDALAPEYLVIGGGNVKKLEELPPKCRRGSNASAFEGGFRLWSDHELKI
ncbi:ROK family protein [Oryzibacter oryziterrae]|uniref:ROK family protein n=1 Tax=Oryzibacter oryziterrae TaxID=2766474 RepID=UPI001F434131|nr:ROK family protein [Oryzibacter oryziterrae]